MLADLKTEENPKSLDIFLELELSRRLQWEKCEQEKLWWLQQRDCRIQTSAQPTIHNDDDDDHDQDGEGDGKHLDYQMVVESVISN